VGLGTPHAELVRVLDEYRLCPQTVLEIGCGTGADAILLSRRRFEVTAVDCSPIAWSGRAAGRAARRPDPFRAGRHLRVCPFGGAVRPRLRLRRVPCHSPGAFGPISRGAVARHSAGSYYLCLAGAPSARWTRPAEVTRTRSTTNWAGCSSSFICADAIRKPGADRGLPRLVLSAAAAGREGT